MEVGAAMMEDDCAVAVGGGKGLMREEGLTKMIPMTPINSNEAAADSAVRIS